MIRLIENCNARKFFKKGKTEALRRYWVFSAYSGPYYLFTDELDIDPEDYDEYIENFLYSGESFVDVGKFDLAFPVFGMDEWTTIIGFVSSRDKAPKIAKYICEHDTRPEKVVLRYPKIELIEFLWVDGWWEIFGDVDVAFDLINPDLVWVDTDTSVYLNQVHDEIVYSKARNELQQRINKKHNVE